MLSTSAFFCHTGPPSPSGGSQPPLAPPFAHHHPDFRLLCRPRQSSNVMGCPAYVTLSPAAVLSPGKVPGPPEAVRDWRTAFRTHVEIERRWVSGDCNAGAILAHNVSEPNRVRSTQRLRAGHPSADGFSALCRQDFIRCLQLRGSSLATCSGSYR